MEYPCDFKLKIIGLNKSSFATEVLSLARKHFPNTNDSSMQSKTSEQGNYLAITLTVYVKDQVTLDMLYVELTQHPDIKMVL